MAKFGKGNKASSGIPKPNAGRPPEWLKAKCDEIIDRYSLLDFLGKVAGGENIEQVVTDQGETIHVPASVKDRIKATEMVLDRRFGKPEQHVDMKSEDVTERPSKSELESALKSIRDLVTGNGVDQKE